MGWDKGRYYTRSRRENGRVVREYFGAGRLGELAAMIDTDRRALHAEHRQREAESRRQLDDLEEAVAGLNGLADLLSQAALYAAGYHRHKRGEWRKRR
jgi:hypothetical protein